MRSNRVTYVIGIALLYLLQSAPAMGQIFPARGLPMAFNGGFAGETGKHRFVSSTHLELMKYERLRTTISETFSYDVFVPRLRSGIGVTAGFMSQQSRSTDSLNWGLRNPYLSVAFSPKISFGGKVTLAPFLDFQFVHSRTVTYFDPNNVYPSIAGNNSRYTLRVGALLNSKKGYVGLTYVPFETTSRFRDSYANRYRFVNYSFPGAESTKWILQAGRTFQKRPDSKFSFTPQFAVTLYKEPRRYYFGLADLNFAFRFNRFHTGLGAGGFQFAYDWDQLRVGTAVFYDRIYGKRKYQTFVNGQLTIIEPYQYTQFLMVRYLIDGEKNSTIE